MRLSTTTLLACALLAGCGEATGPALILGPAGANTFDDLVLTIDGGSPEKYEITWTVDEEVRSDLTSTTIPATETRKGEVWSVTVVKGSKESTAEIEIGNAKPSAEVTISPGSPTSADSVTATGVAFDPDDDPAYTEYEWRRSDGDSGIRSRTLESASTRRGEIWTVVVTPYDGTEAGPPAELSFEIVNAKPEVMDSDGDPVTLIYTWYVNGTKLDGVTTKSLDGSAGHFEAGDEVYCTIAGNDGITTGAARATPVVKIVNSGPSAPVVAVTPAEPYSDEDLLCEVTEVSIDPDGDPVTYTASWEVNDAPFTFGSETIVPGDTVPATYTRPEEVWTCVMKATDGKGGNTLGETSVFVDSRSGCADGTTEVEWSVDMEGCLAAAKTSWNDLAADVAAVCADGWEMAKSDIVNTVLNGPGYTDAWLLAFNGEGCEGTDAFASTRDSLSSGRPACVWRTSHHTKVSDPTAATLDGIVCVRSDEP
jgi:hypothetical protein